MKRINKNPKSDAHIASIRSDVEMQVDVFNEHRFAVILQVTNFASHAIVLVRVRHCKVGSNLLQMKQDSMLNKLEVKT